MLVLTRKAGESIVINGNITLTVVQVAPGRVRIGVQAPSHVSIDRSEVAARKEADAAEPTAVTGPAIHNRLTSRFPTAMIAKPR